jgi:hypothetical protein
LVHTGQIICVTLRRNNAGSNASQRFYRQRAWFRRLEISFNQGDKWKALVNTYIIVIPLIGDESDIAMQSMSG